MHRQVSAPWYVPIKRWSKLNQQYFLLLPILYTFRFVIYKNDLHIKKLIENKKAYISKYYHK